jgi:hypothetical protein
MEVMEMIRLTFMSGKWRGTKINTVEKDAENIEAFVDNDEPCLIIDNIDTLESLNCGINPEDVEIV